MLLHLAEKNGSRAEIWNRFSPWAQLRDLHDFVPRVRSLQVLHAEQIRLALALGLGAVRQACGGDIWMSGSASGWKACRNDYARGKEGRCLQNYDPEGLLFFVSIPNYI